MTGSFYPIAMSDAGIADAKPGEAGAKPHPAREASRVGHPEKSDQSC